MEKIIPYLVLLIGIVMALPLLNITQLGVAADWIVVLAVLVVGVLLLLKK